MPEKSKFTLRLECGHNLGAETRPNPRKMWPDPQTCESCKKKKRVVEIWSPRVSVANLTAPGAPKDYVKQLKKGLR